MKENNYRLSRRFYSVKTIQSYMEKEKMLGCQSIDSVIHFLNIRLFLSILLFIYLLIILEVSVILTVLFTILFYQGFSYFIFDFQIKQREKILEKEAIYFFEVLELSLASGKNLIQSFKVTTSSIDNHLSNEFKKVLKEIDYGKSFYDAFTDLRKRIPSDSIQNVILNIVEAYTSGGMITKTLSEQIDFIRNKRVMEIKKEMNQIPIKVSVVSVFLFIPLVLLLVLSPVILEYFMGL